MSCNSNQCCAPSNNKRCELSAIPGSHHCKDHHDTSKELYLNYKKICDVAYSFDLDKTFKNKQARVKYLFKAHTYLNKAFDARMKHRQYSYTPECYDEGHNFQFVKIKELINQCENVLCSLHQATIPINQEIDEVEQEDNSPNLIIEKIIKSRNKRKASQNHEDSLIKKYIKSNEIVLNRKRELIKTLVDTIMELFKGKIDFNSENHKDDVFFFSISVNNLIYELARVNYFLPDFTPEKCACEDCENHSRYVVRLACGCIGQTDTTMKYFSLSTENALKTCLEYLIQYKHKILPFIDDILTLHKIYDYNFIFIRNLEFEWKKDQSRFMLKQSECDISSRGMLRKKISILKSNRGKMRE